jgi:hypothetical protein
MTSDQRSASYSLRRVPVPNATATSGKNVRPFSFARTSPICLVLDLRRFDDMGDIARHRLRPHGALQRAVQDAVGMSDRARGKRPTRLAAALDEQRVPIFNVGGLSICKGRAPRCGMICCPASCLYRSKVFPERPVGLLSQALRCSLVADR